MVWIQILRWIENGTVYHRQEFVGCAMVVLLPEDALVLQAITHEWTKENGGFTDVLLRWDKVILEMYMLDGLCIMAFTWSCLFTLLVHFIVHMCSLLLCHSWQCVTDTKSGIMPDGESANANACLNHTMACRYQSSHKEIPSSETGPVSKGLCEEFITSFEVV